MNPDTIFDLERQHKARYAQPHAAHSEGWVYRNNLATKSSRVLSKLGDHLVSLGQKLQTNVEQPTVSLQKQPTVES